MGEVVLCVDFGSTFTKAALVDAGSGTLLGTASHRTTIDTDVLDGYDACLGALRADHPEADGANVLACSSAGGGLRVAVVGNEELVTAEAGRRVALSSGGKVVHVVALAADADPLPGLLASRPDVVLLVGGTDGGNTEALLAGARMLAGARWATPVVVAGNVDAREDVAGLLAASATPYVLADNVVPRIGVLAPGSARAAIREMFLAHVIGGKHLSARTDFAAMVRGPTPDLVLTGVEVLAATLACDVVVVDVGGATTDVHSVVDLDPEDATLGREVVATTPVTRTVEGDLGMRWSAVSTVESGVAAGVLESRPGAGPGGPAAARRPGAPARRPGRRVVRHAHRDRGHGARRPPARRAVARRAERHRAGHRAHAARTSARSTCWSARAGCCATRRPRWPRGSCARWSAPTRRAGSSPSGPRWSSTATTSSPPSACSRVRIPRRRARSRGDTSTRTGARLPGMPTA